MKDYELLKLLKSLKTIVMIGASANPVKASFFVGRYFILRGVRIIPINPKYEGQKLWGEKFLKNIFRACITSSAVRSQRIGIFNGQLESRLEYVSA